MTPVALLQLSVLQHAKAHDFSFHFVVAKLHRFSASRQTLASPQSFITPSSPFRRVKDNVEQKPDGQLTGALVHFCCSFGCIDEYPQ
jgi:hypothetical protein